MKYYKNYKSILCFGDLFFSINFLCLIILLKNKGFNIKSLLFNNLMKF